MLGSSIATNLRFLRHGYGIDVSALDTGFDGSDDINIRGLYQGEIWKSLIVLRQEIVKYPLSIPHSTKKDEELKNRRFNVSSFGVA